MYIWQDVEFYWDFVLRFCDDILQIQKISWLLRQLKHFHSYNPTCFQISSSPDTRVNRSGCVLDQHSCNYSYLIKCAVSLWLLSRISTLIYTPFHWFYPLVCFLITIRGSVSVNLFARTSSIKLWYFHNGDHGYSYFLHLTHLIDLWLSVWKRLQNSDSKRFTGAVQTTRLYAKPSSVA